MVESIKAISDSFEGLIQNELNLVENREFESFLSNKDEKDSDSALILNSIIESVDLIKSLNSEDTDSKKDNKETLRSSGMKNESSSECSSSDGNFEVVMNEKSELKFKFKKNSQVNFSIKPLKSSLFKDNTLGMTPSSLEETYTSVKGSIKSHIDFTLNLLEKFKKIDKKQYLDLKEKQVTSPKIRNVFYKFFVLNKNFFDQFLVFFLNSYEEEEFRRLFESFLLTFDRNSDKKIQMKEMIEYFEFLTQEKYIGKKKMKVALKEIEVYVKDPINCFHENTVPTTFNELTYINLFNMYKFTYSKKKLLSYQSQYIDLFKIGPLMIALFLEYKNKLFLSKKQDSETIIGIPRKINSIGKLVFDPSGVPKGLYREFINLLKLESDIKKPLISYRIVCEAILKYRANNLPKLLNSESINRILNDLKILMDVDPVSQESKKKFSIKELLPEISGRILTEIKWTSSNNSSSIEKYDEMVNTLGGALCYSVNKKLIHKMMSKAFNFMPFPNFDQFVKGLDYVLHRAIPTLLTPAAIFIAIELIKTPENTKIEEPLSDTKNIKFNLRFILQNDDLFQRLLYFTTNTKLMLVFARVLYKDHYFLMKKNKKVNQKIFIYNKIMKNTSLFDEFIPGLYGDFDDVKVALLKSKEPKQIKKDEKMRKELKMKRFLEFIMYKDTRSNEKMIARRLALRKLRNFNDRDDFIPNFQQKKKIFSLQLEATSIDEKINSREREKKHFQSNLRESNALPNSNCITPEIIFNCIQNSSRNSSDVRNLARFIYTEKEKINFQDIHKFMFNQHLKKISGNEGEMIDYPSVYQVMEETSASLIDGDGLEENNFEENYFAEIKNKKDLYLNDVNVITERKITKRRGCCCLVF